MPDVAVLNAVAGVSSFFGLIGVLAYLFYDKELKRAEQSIADVIGDRTTFTPKDVVNVLSQFSTDEARLRALEALTKFGRAGTEQLYSKVKDNVDVERLTKLQNHHRQQVAAGSGVFFFAIGILSLVFALNQKEERAGGDTANPPAAASAPSSAAGVKVKEESFRSGNLPSGKGAAFSDFYELCSVLPPEAKIWDSKFTLSGDRNDCTSWARCQQTVATANKVCWKFSLQGHSEDGSSHMSEGHLWVKYSVE